MIIAADSTPLIHLSTVSDLGLLQKLSGRILIPEAVRGEIVAGGPGLMRQAHFLLMDERRAVTHARFLGIEVLRTLGIYDYAKRLGLIKAVRPKIDALRQQGFWLSEKDYQEAIRSFGEHDPQ